MRLITLATLLALAACSGHNKPLPEVASRDPVWQLNPDRWTARENDLITPPGDGSSHPLPPAVKTVSIKVPE